MAVPAWTCQRRLREGIIAFGARGTGHEYLLLSRSWHEQIIYRASGVKLFLCDQGKAAQIYPQNILYECYGGSARVQARKL